MKVDDALITELVDLADKFYEENPYCPVGCKRFELASYLVNAIPIIVKHYQGERIET